jgi:hypothetical protein
VLTILQAYKVILPSIIEFIKLVFNEPSTLAPLATFNDIDVVSRPTPYHSEWLETHRYKAFLTPRTTGKKAARTINLLPSFDPSGGDAAAASPIAVFKSGRSKSKVEGRLSPLTPENFPTVCNKREPTSATFAKDPKRKRLNGSIQKNEAGTASRT